VVKLAQRSQAAGEIGELSGSSVETAQRAGKTLADLVPNVQKTADLVQEISAATGEQDRGAEQINRAISQLDRVIQQNTGASEEMAASSAELTREAEHLQQSISFFRLGDSGTGVTLARPADVGAQRHVEAPVPGTVPGNGGGTDGNGHG
jgi:methyl-accepting chemotaxis protein